MAYGVFYPSAFALWESYRHPGAFLGRGLPIHVVDYDDVAAAVTEHLTRTGVVVSELAHEIGWLTGNPTVHFPLTEAQLRFLVEKFNVSALYRRPDTQREWPWIAEAFSQVDSHGVRLWVQRDVGSGR